MEKLLNIGRQMSSWWSATKYIIAIILVVFLIINGLHPVWGILLFLYRKAAMRVCIFLGLLFWLTQGII